MSFDTNTTATTAATSVTGRDGYITLKAMLYAIASIQSLPEADQEHGDLQDMRALVRAKVHDMARNDATHDVPVLFCHTMLEVHRHTGQMPDLWSNEFGDDPGEIYEPHELALKDAVLATLAGMERDMAAFFAKFNRDHALGEAA